MTMFLLIGVIVLFIAVVFLCISVVKLKANEKYYDNRIIEFDKRIERISMGQKSLFYGIQHTTKKTKELEEILKDKIKTNAEAFYDTYGFSVPSDMYYRYHGFWNSEYKHK